MSRRDGPRPYRPQIVRYLDANGKQVPKGTPGAKRVRTKSRTYFVDFTGPDLDRRGKPKRHHIQLKTSDLHQAWANLRDLLKQRQEEQLGIRTPQTDQRARPLADHLDDWVAALTASGDTEKHIMTCRSQVARLAELAGWQRLGDLSADSCLQALSKLQRLDDLSAQTRNHYLSHAKQFARWAVLAERLPSNPLASVRKANVQLDRRHDRRCPTDEEVAKLFAYLAGPAKVRNRLSGAARALGYRVAMGTGLRASEIRSLSRASFDLDSTPPTVRVAAAYSKHRRVDTLPLPSWLADELRAWFAAGGGCWGTLPKVFPGRALQADLKAAGVSYCVDGLYFDYHALRFHYISALASQPGIDPKTLMTLARHSDPKLTLAIYAKSKTAQTQQAADNIPRPGTTGGTTPKA